MTVFNYKAIIGNSGPQQTKDTLRTGAQTYEGHFVSITFAVTMAFIGMVEMARKIEV